MHEPLAWLLAIFSSQLPRSLVNIKTMRKKEKEIIERSEIDQIIKNSEVCRIAFAKDNIPYIVPLSFGYDGKNLYIHTATRGKKIDFIKSNNTICFEFDLDVKTISHATIGCKWTAAYRSVIGNGKIYEIYDKKQMADGLNQIMLQYSGKKWEFTEKMLNNVRVWKIEIVEITGKKSH